IAAQRLARREQRAEQRMRDALQLARQKTSDAKASLSESERLRGVATEKTREANAALLGLQTANANLTKKTGEARAATAKATRNAKAARRAQTRERAKARHDLAQADAFRALALVLENPEASLAFALRSLKLDRTAFAER